MRLVRDIDPENRLVRAGRLRGGRQLGQQGKQAEGGEKKVSHAGNGKIGVGVGGFKQTGPGADRTGGFKARGTKVRSLRIGC